MASTCMETGAVDVSCTDPLSTVAVQPTTRGRAVLKAMTRSFIASSSVVFGGWLGGSGPPHVPSVAWVRKLSNGFVGLRFANPTYIFATYDALLRTRDHGRCQVGDFAAARKR